MICVCVSHVKTPLHLNLFGCLLRNILINANITPCMERSTTELHLWSKTNHFPKMTAYLSNKNVPLSILRCKDGTHRSRIAVENVFVCV